jgi:hypothetical protein
MKTRSIAAWLTVAGAFVVLCQKDEQFTPHVVVFVRRPN